MFYKFQKEEFLVIYQEQEGGVIVTVYNNQNNMVFGMVKPGNVYMLSNNQWTLIDISFIKTYKDYIDRAVKALTTIITKIPVEDKILKLTSSEVKTFNILSRDITEGRVDWLNNDDVYHFSPHGIIGITAGQIKMYEYPEYENNMENIPHLIISPAITPDRLVSHKNKNKNNNDKTPVVRVGLKTVQKSPQPIKTAKNNDDFYKLVRDRAQWKKENPMPDSTDEIDRYIKLEREQREREAIEKKMKQEE